MSFCVESQDETNGAQLHWPGGAHRLVVLLEVPGLTVGLEQSKDR